MLAGSVSRISLYAAIEKNREPAGTHQSLLVQCLLARFEWEKTEKCLKGAG